MKEPRPKCIAGDCDKSSVCKSYCMVHYSRWKDYGRLEKVTATNKGNICWQKIVRRMQSRADIANITMSNLLFVLIGQKFQEAMVYMPYGIIEKYETPSFQNGIYSRTFARMLAIDRANFII